MSEALKAVAEKNFYEVARYVGITGDQATRLIGALFMCGYSPTNPMQLHELEAAERDAMAVVLAQEGTIARLTAELAAQKSDAAIIRSLDTPPTYDELVVLYADALGIARDRKAELDAIAARQEPKP